MYFLASTFWLIGNVERSCNGLDMHTAEVTNFFFFLNQF